MYEVGPGCDKNVLVVFYTFMLIFRIYRLYILVITLKKEYSKDKCGVQLFNSFVKVIKELQKTPWNSKEKMYENF